MQQIMAKAISKPKVEDLVANLKNAATNNANEVGIAEAPNLSLIHI